MLVISCFFHYSTYILLIYISECVKQINKSTIYKLKFVFPLVNVCYRFVIAFFHKSKLTEVTDNEKDIGKNVSFIVGYAEIDNIY